jgi:hypothetical protein
VTAKESWVVPVLPSLTLASAIDSAGSGGGGGGGVTPALSSVSPDIAVPPAPVVAWKPKLAWLPAATLAFQSALLIT